MKVIPIAHSPLVSPAEKMFVQEYLVDFNAPRAYVAVYAVTGNPSLEARRLLSEPRILAEVTARIEEQGKNLFLKKEAILSRVWQEALNPFAKPAERLKALELAAKLIGAMDTKGESHAPSLNITINDPGNVLVSQDLPSGKHLVQSAHFDGTNVVVEEVVDVTPKE